MWHATPNSPNKKVHYKKTPSPKQPKKQQQQQQQQQQQKQKPHF